MEATQINTAMSQSDKQVIEGLQETLKFKSSELEAVTIKFNEANDKLKAARKENRQRKELIEGQIVTIAGLEDELNKAATVTVSDNSDTAKVNKAVSYLEMAMLMNGDSEKVSRETINIIYKALTGNPATAGSLLIESK